MHNHLGPLHHITCMVVLTGSQIRFASSSPNTPTWDMRPNQGEGDQAHQDPPRRAPPWSLPGEERLWGPMSLLIHVLDAQESRSLFCAFFQHESSSHFQIWKYSCIGHTWKLLPYCPCWALEHPHKWGPRALQNFPVFSSKTQIFFWHFCARLMGSSSSSWSCPGWPRLDPCPLHQGRRKRWSQWTMEREKLKAKPWPANTWQMSRHLAAKEESLSSTAVIVVYFWIRNFLEEPENCTCFFFRSSSCYANRIGVSISTN